MNKVDPEVLSKSWGIGKESARRMVKVTTQRGVRRVLYPPLSRRFRTNDRQLRYRRLRSDAFGDRLEASVKSRRGNTYAEVFGTSFGWSRVFPAKLKSVKYEGQSRRRATVYHPTSSSTLRENRRWVSLRRRFTMASVHSSRILAVKIRRLTHLELIKNLLSSGVGQRIYSSGARHQSM
jgi:hypothetical protein